MTAEQLAKTCWYFPSDAWEEPHFGSRGEAQDQEDQWAVDDEHPPRPAQEHGGPCWRVFCDGCGEEVEDDESAYHHATYADAVAFENTWTYADGDRRMCFACVEDAGVSATPPQVDPTTPMDLALTPAGSS